MNQQSTFTESNYISFKYYNEKKRKQLSELVYNNRRGIKFLDPRDSDEEVDKKQLISALAILYNNLAAAQLQV